MEFLSTLFSFILVIGILVFVHELGHFLTALWTGMRADVFAIGMGPRMLGWNKINGFTFGPLSENIELGQHTDYRICWLPIGGYVRILGMVDESFDTDFKDKPAEPWEFRSKKNWQKAIVLVAGVVMNLLLAVAVFWFLPLFNGQDEWKTTTIGWVDPSSVAFEYGLRDNDEVIAVDGKAVDTWTDLNVALGLTSQNADHNVSIKRASQPVSVQIPGKGIVKALANGEGLGVYPHQLQTVISAVVFAKPAEKAGMKKGDVVLAIDSTPVRAIPQFQKIIRSHSGRSITMHVERGSQVLPLTVTVDKDSTIGIGIEPNFVGSTLHREFGVFEAAGMALAEVGNTVGLIVTSVGHVITGTVGVRQSFGGPIKIAQMASRSQELGLEPFLRFMALISISLAVMNLLPLPGLDGGHLVFVAIESITRREIPTNVKIRFQQFGIAILLALMAFIFYLDLT